LSKFDDKQRYLNYIAKGKSHRQIAKMGRWTVSSSIIRDELLRDGVIFENKVKIDAAGKNHVFYKLTGKAIPSEANAECWSDGTPKSRGNAFDLSIAKGLFNKSELAASLNKGKPLNYNIPIQVITYSRA
jgi:hypothetical protein